MSTNADCVMLALDTSTKSSGIAVFINGVLKETCLINKSNIASGEDRVKEMIHSLYTLFMRKSPDIIYIEDVKKIINAVTMRQLMQIQGAVLGWCIQNNCEFNTISPAAWRKELNFQTGKNIKREQLKQQAIDYVKNTYQLTLNDDAAEAVCIGDAVVSKFQHYEEKQNRAE